MLTSALPGTQTHRLGQRESVVLLAALMSLNALGIDAMVPALPQIGSGLGATTENQRQLVIICYMLGFGMGQIGWGPLSDRFGRRPVLAVGLLLYALFASACAAAPSFPLMIAGRVAMGAAAASTRVLVTAVVRDLFEGEQMARVMSLVFMVFMVVPVLAPSLGQALLQVAPWRAIFLALAGMAVLLLGWSMLRLPETLNPTDRRSLDVREIAEAAWSIVRDRLAVGYTLASSALFGALSAYIASIQQIVADVFHAPDRLPIVFGAVAAPMAVAAWTNSKIVGRFGLRQIGHVGLIGYLLFASAHLAYALLAEERLVPFVLFQALILMSFALCSANFSTLAMTNMGHLAGTASSVQGVVSTVCGALIGLAIGQAFNGTVVPFLAGSALCALISLGIVMVTERGRLLQPLSS